MVRQRGSQSLLSLGLEWSSKVTAIGLEFSIPALLGFGVDHWLRTIPAATVAGAVLGFVLGMMHTMRIARELPGGKSGRRNSAADQSESPRTHGHGHDHDDRSNRPLSDR